jgi:hypothetical protein
MLELGARLAYVGRQTKVTKLVLHADHGIRASGSTEVQRSEEGPPSCGLPRHDQLSK